MNEVWVEIVMLAHDLIVRTRALLLDGELAKAEPKRMRYQLLHVAARLAFSGRQGGAPPPSLALDRSAQSSVRETQNAPRRDRLNLSRNATHPPSRPGHQPDHPCPKPRPKHRRRSRERAQRAAHADARPTATHPPNPAGRSQPRTYCMIRASTHAGAWQYRPAVTLSGRLTSRARSRASPSPASQAAATAQGRHSNRHGRDVDVRHLLSLGASWRRSSFRHITRVPRHHSPDTWAAIACWHAAVPFTFRIRVSHWTQEPSFEFLPAAPGIQQSASRRISLLGHPIPAGGLGPPDGRLTAEGRTPTGLPRSARTSYERGGRLLYPEGRRCSSRPSRLLARRLPLCCGQSFSPAPASHVRGSPRRGINEG